MDGLCRWRGENWDDLDRQSVVWNFRTTAVLAKRRTAIRKFRIVQREGRRVTLSRKTAKNETLPKGWQRVKLGETYNISASGDLDAKASSPIQDEKHPYPTYSNALTNKGLHSYSSYAKYDEDSITITARGDIGFANHRTTKFMAIGRLLVLNTKVPISNKFVCEYITIKLDFLKRQQVFHNLQHLKQVNTMSYYHNSRNKNLLRLYWKHGTRRLRKPKH